MRMRLRASASERPVVRESSRAALAPSADVGNLQMQSARRSATASISFPHQQEIRHALGTQFSFAAVHDPAGCAARGTPAFNEGGVAHFAEPSPDLRVAAHEATHQLQNAGKSNDAGLGPEGHAGAVAERVTAGRSAKNLIGSRGRPVASATRGFVFTDKDGNWQNVSTSGGALSDTGQTLTFHNREAYADPALIGAANAQLHKQKSRVDLSVDSGAGKVVTAPLDGTPRYLAKIKVTQPDHPGSDTLPERCDETAREIMGPAASGKPASAVASPGGLTSDISPIIQKQSPKEVLALTLYLDQRIRALPGYPNVTDEEKRAEGKRAYREYEALSDTEKRQFIEKVDGKTLPSGRAKELGVDQYAQPDVGEAYTVIRTGPDDPNGYPFHWATVIMAPGHDRVTLENAATRDPLASAENDKWYMETYGPPGSGHTFHDEEAKHYGADAHTLRVRTQSPLELDAPMMRTWKLIQALSTGGDEALIRDEVRKRSLSINIAVDETLDSSEDDVFCVIGTAVGGMTVSTGIAELEKGQSNWLTMPLFALFWPLPDPIHIAVYAHHTFSADGFIGSLELPSPYHPLVNVKLASGKARYVVTVSL